MGSMLRPVPLVLRRNLWRRDILQPKLRNETRAFTDQRNKQSGIVVQIAGSNIYRFGDSNIATPIFRDVKWTIKEGENWAVVGSGSSQKTALLQALRGHLRLAPPPLPPGGLFPFLSDPPRDPHNAIALVSFAHRPQSSGGAFYDYSARYGAVRDEDKITLRESMFGDYDFLNIRPKAHVGEKSPAEIASEKVKKDIFEDLTARLGLSSLLDLPLVALSNGQTRRARIVKAIMSEPGLLLLDEPLTGLDLNNRPTLLSVLESLHNARKPRIIMGLRKQDPIPEWITHLALIKDDRIIAGEKGDILDQQAKYAVHDGVSGPAIPCHDRLTGLDDTRKPVAILKNVNVTYGTRKVLDSINWTIREGQRWHLQGANGSGKTTLMSVITGDHPQSYTQRGESYLELFSRPRPKIPTSHLCSSIGIVSPELANAYPRRAQTSVWEVIGTGFDGTFVPGGKNGIGIGLEGELTDDIVHWRVNRIREVLSGLGPSSWMSSGARHKGQMSEVDEAFSKRDFIDLSAGEQSIVLLMRALVGRPPLVLLDEVWSGMDDAMVRAARQYLRTGGITPDQAVVVISHWEEEVPWSVEEGLRRIRLEEGNGKLDS